MDRYPWLLPVALVVIGIKCIVLYGGGLVLLAGLAGAFFGLGWAIIGMVGVGLLLVVGAWFGYAARRNVCPIPPAWIRAMKRTRRSPRPVPIRTEPVPGATVEGSTPAVRIWFNHAVSAPYSKVWVVDEAGVIVHAAGSRPVPADPSLLVLELPGLPAGRYTVHWRSVSAETGHSAGGQFAFNVAGPVAERQIAISHTA